MDNIFRNIFGFPPRSRQDRSGDYTGDNMRFPFEPPRHHQSNEDDEESFPHHRGFHANDVGDMIRHFEEMFKSFDNIFRDIGVAEFPSHPAITPAPDQPTAPRDHMLKKPDSQPQPPSQGPALPFARGIWSMPQFEQPQHPHDKVDRDLDTENDLDLSHLPFYGQEEPTRTTPFNHNPFVLHSQQVTVRKYRNVDGNVEEECIVRDGSGNVERTVTHWTPDGQEHMVKMRTTPDGKMVSSDSKNNILGYYQGRFEAAPSIDRELIMKLPVDDRTPRDDRTPHNDHSYGKLFYKWFTNIY